MFTLEIFTKIFAVLGPCQSQVLKYAPNILMVADCSMQNYLLSNLFIIQSHLLVLYGVPLAQSMVHNDYSVGSFDGGPTDACNCKVTFWCFYDCAVSVVLNVACMSLRTVTPAPAALAIMLLIFDIRNHVSLRKHSHSRLA